MPSLASCARSGPYARLPLLPASDWSSPILLAVSRVVDASLGMVTIPLCPILAADGQPLSVSPRPASPLAGGFGWASVTLHWASSSTASVGEASVILPFVALPAANVAQASEIPRSVFLHVPAVDRESAACSHAFLPVAAPCRRAAPFLAEVPWASASLCLAVLPAVGALMVCASALPFFLRAIPAMPATRAPLPIGSDAPAAARRVGNALPDVQDLPHAAPPAPHSIPPLPPRLS
ncbi:unnamed protein product [Closterium sp. Naga37s-1]|nr:unnamed protein product [Closterium sp. Naga37s-1]